MLAVSRLMISRSTSMMSQPYSQEKQFAIAAVRRACLLTHSIHHNLVEGLETVTKNDKTPVTVGDYAAQSLVNTMLSSTYPSDPIVGEESASDLRNEAAAPLRERIIALANEYIEKSLEGDEKTEWGIGPGKARSGTDLLHAIDRGNFMGGRTGRAWCLDPIDGTKGFLRKNGQYAVCLALLVDAQVQLGVIGCPNLPCSPDTPLDSTDPEVERGCLFVAVRGQGAQQIALSPFPNPKSIPISIPPISNPSSLSFLESVEAAHSSHGFNALVTQILGIKKDAVRMDSQAKYCCLARGQGGAYLRMPTGVGYREKIWDHAPGSLLISEANGTVSDSRGQPLDFGLGRDLGENYGVIATGRDVHPALIAGVKEALEMEKVRS